MPHINAKEYETLYPGKYGYALTYCEQCSRMVLIDAGFKVCECGAVLPIIVERRAK